jgi:hypothetical protein
MSSDLETFRDHCIRMAKSRHKPECELPTPRYYIPRGPHPDCTGCNPISDRILFKRLAQEITAHLDKQQESNTPIDADQLELL